MNLKSKLLIGMMIFCVLFTLTGVSAANNQSDILSDNYHPISELNQSISESGSELNLENDYKNDGTKLIINKTDDFTINGNGHEINGMTKDSGLVISTNNTLTFNNLTFKNCTNLNIQFSSPVTFNNVKFIDCSGSEELQVFIYGNPNADLFFNNCTFQMNEGNYNPIIANNAKLLLNNATINMKHLNNAFILANRVNLVIENTNFENITTNYTIINFKGWDLTVKKSKFTNLHSSLSAAFLAKFIPSPEKKAGNILVEDCIFSNVTSVNDGGAIFFDCDSAATNLVEPFNIKNVTFENCKSKFGGALADLGGNLTILNSRFINNTANYEGGAIYTSWASLNIINSTISDNDALSNAGALYFDKGKLTIDNTNITNNKVAKKSDNAAVVYANDAELNIKDSNFNNGGVGVYANFAGDSKIENVEKNDDIFLLDNKDYVVSIENKGIKLNLTENEIIVDKLPSRFNATEWGWISPVKKQGDNDDCWAFATAASLEASLLKSTGTYYNLSSNYVPQYQLRYDPNGDLRNVLTGFSYSGLGYALSWNGALLMTTPYDDRGTVGRADEDESRIHVQDAMIIFGGRNDTQTLIKEAILKYGSVTAQIIRSSPENLTPDSIPIMDHGTHFITLIGWNDHYTNPQNETEGVWIIKESLSGLGTTEYNTEGLVNIDNYAIVAQQAAIAYIFENTIDYHVNYQTDITGLTGFDGAYTYYSNEYTSKYSELIGAVGTYFNESGIEYSFDIYVNGKLVHTQKGVSEFAGFRTIVLNKYIPVKTADKFKVVFKNNALPYQAFSRQHYMENKTFVSSDGENWSDFASQNKTVCLKVYTVADDTKISAAKNIAVDYAGGKYFSVKVVTADGRAVGAGEAVKFTINGKTTTVKTDNNGIAKIKITQIPKTYTIKTTYKGKTVKNTVKVKHVVTSKKVTAKKTAKKFTLTAKLKINGKLIKGKKIKFKLNGKTYTAKTNSKGVAKVTIKKNIINKLKKGKTYTVKVSYSKDIIKTSVKIK